MIEDKLTRGERRRLESVAQAIALQGVTMSRSDDPVINGVITHAKVIEAYVAGLGN